MPQSNEFLSGEVDRSLGSVLGSLSIHDNNNNRHNDFSKTEANKIRVIGVSSDHDDDDDDSDDESPPPIDAGESMKVPSNTPSTSSSPSTIDSVNEKESENDVPMPSLMEQMMKEALQARGDEQDKKKSRERKSAKTSSFGFKKGFLSAGSKPKPRANAKVKVGKKKDQRSTCEKINNTAMQSDKVRLIQEYCYFYKWIHIISRIQKNVSISLFTFLCENSY